MFQSMPENAGGTFSLLDKVAVSKARRDFFWAAAFLDAFDLRSALLTAETVALTALARNESRGAHQREDLPDADPAFERNQIVQLNNNGNPVTDWAEVVRADYSLSPVETVK